MRRRKQIAAFVLCAVMGIMTVGCGQKAETASQPESGVKTEADQNGAEAKAEGQTDAGTAAEGTGQKGAGTPLDTAAKAAEHETFKIGVINGAFDNESNMRQKYLEEYVAPLFNVKFIFSEAIHNGEEEVTFVENLAAAGGKALMAYRYQNREQIARLCSELGIYYVYNGEIQEGDQFDGLDTFVGTALNTMENIEDVYSEAVEDWAKTEGEHGFVILSALAAQENIQHKSATSTVLKTLAKSYGLTYEQSVEELTVVSEPTEAANDAGIPIYIYPGIPNNDAFLNGISSALQTGKYDMVLASSNLFNQLGVIVDENEKAIGRNIRVVSIANVSPELQTAVNTVDSYGEPSLNACVVKPPSYTSGPMFAMLYNALTGHMDILKPEGQPKTIIYPQWGCLTPEDVRKVGSYDLDSDSYTFDEEHLRSVIYDYNPDLTLDSFQDVVSKGTLDRVIEYMNGKGK